MKLKQGDYLYRTDIRIDKEGQRWTDTFRRPVELVSNSTVTLGNVEKASALEGAEPYDWKPWGGVFGSATRAPNERLKTLQCQLRKKR